MVKDCKVILNNEAVTVARFGDIDIQFPSIHRKAKQVRVLFKNGKYKIVNDDFHEEPFRYAKEKKTTNTEIVEHVVNNVPSEE